MKGLSTRIAAALGLTLASALPGWAQTTNQRTADEVAAALRAHPGLAASRITIETRSGVVTLGGVVPSPELKREALDRAGRVGGITAVADRLAIGDPRVVPVRYQAMEADRVALGGHLGHGGFAGGAPIQGGMVAGDAAPMPGGMVAGGGMVASDPNGPLPEGPAVGGASGAGLTGTPNYAWPSYAPYPNFSAVGYPTVYPWQAWPNIGPFYPYPEVPLDWRAVTLRWDDGLWWLDFKKHYTRPFFTPYPFGLFAY